MLYEPTRVSSQTPVEPKARQLKGVKEPTESVLYSINWLQLSFLFKALVTTTQRSKNIVR